MNGLRLTSASISAPSDPPAKNRSEGPAAEVSRSSDHIKDSAGSFDRRLEDAEFKQSVHAANERLGASGLAASFSFDVKLGRAVLSITDIHTNRVIFQVPSETAQRLQKQIDQLTGIIVDRYE